MDLARQPKRQKWDFELQDFLTDAESTLFHGRKNRNDESREEGNEAYNAFLEKFKAKKTTDDCYTPENIYQARGNNAVVAGHICSVPVPSVQGQGGGYVQAHPRQPT